MLCPLSNYLLCSLAIIKHRKHDSSSKGEYVVVVGVHASFCIVPCVIGERERETETETETETERNRDRDTETQRDTERQRQRHRDTDTDRHGDRARHRKTQRHRNRDSERQKETKRHFVWRDLLINKPDQSISHSHYLISQYNESEIYISSLYIHMIPVFRPKAS